MGVGGRGKGEVIEGWWETALIMIYKNSRHSICYRNTGWGGGDPNGPCYPTILLVIFIISLTVFITMLIIFVVKITLNLSYFLSSEKL